MGTRAENLNRHHLSQREMVAFKLLLEEYRYNGTPLTIVQALEVPYEWIDFKKVDECGATFDEISKAHLVLMSEILTDAVRAHIARAVAAGSISMAMGLGIETAWTFVCGTHPLSVRDNLAREILEVTCSGLSD